MRWGGGRESKNHTRETGLGDLGIQCCHSPEECLRVGEERLWGERVGVIWGILGLQWNTQLEVPNKKTYVQGEPAGQFHR